jgi:hypothetical protein
MNFRLRHLLPAWFALALACDSVSDEPSGMSSTGASTTDSTSRQTDSETDGSSGTSSHDDTDTSSSCAGEAIECGCGDHFEDAVCVDGNWVCEDLPPTTECPGGPIECDGTNDDEAPDCVASCDEPEMVLGPASCWVNGEWSCEEGTRVDTCE